MNIVVDGVDQFGSIDVDTDNLVIWTEGPLQSNGEGESIQAKDQPLEIYMEGNVVFRQGERTIYAQRMYYDVRRQTGIVLAAEMLTPVPKFEGLMKLRADVVQQIGRDRFVAQNASLTSSRFGVPGYELRSSLMTYDDVQHPRINPLTGTPEVDPNGDPIIDHEKLVTSRNNVVYLEQVPVFYWPFMATDLEQPNYYIDVDPRHQRPDLRHPDHDRHQRLPVVRHSQQAAGHEVGHQRRLPEPARTGRRHHVQLRAADAVRRAGQHQRLLRLLGHRRPRARQPRLPAPRFHSGKHLRSRAAEFPRPLPGPASATAARATSS